MTPVLESPKMKILITGSGGQIGWELCHALARLGEIIALDRAALDLTKPASIQHAVRNFKPALIVNAGGHTAVDRAESERDLAFAANAEGPRVLAEEAEQCGAALIHYSTDYIFDGAKGSPYAPSDSPNPLNVYGASKLAGEQAVLASGASALILRTSWVYGIRRSSFLRTMLNMCESPPASGGRTLRIVNDQRGCPTWSRHVARATARIIESSIVNGGDGVCFGKRGGVYHLTSAGVTTWCDFARAIFDSAQIANSPEIHPISTDAYGAPARRPAYSALDCSATERDFGVALPNWRDALDETIAARAQEAAACAAMRSNVA